MEDQVQLNKNIVLNSDEEQTEENESRFGKSFIKYLLFAIPLVHIFGIFGFFISLPYPVAWFFRPSSVFCFYCLHQRLTHKGHHGYCPVCQREVVTIFSPPFKSMIINMISMLFFSLISLVIVSLEVGLITQASTNFLSPNKQANFIAGNVEVSHKVGTPFYFDILINTDEQAINLVKSDISFSTDILEVKEIDTSKSFANIFSNKEFSNANGTINIIGGLPSPGYIGSQGLFARIYFNPTKPGVGTIHILESSRILANDGKGTDILKEYTTFPVSVEP